MIGIAERTQSPINTNQKNVTRFEDSVERLTNRHRFLVVSGVCLFYLVPTIELARRKLIWTDEFFTLYLGRLNPRDLWAALLTGGDQHPPVFYLVHRLFLRAFGENPWALRLPAILGFLLMMVCVYLFMAKRTSVAYGLVAMLIPLATIAHDYAYEARGYSLLLGFLALAVLGWQQTGERSQRGAGILILAAGLTGGILSHYYTVLLLPPIAAAEAVRSFRRRSWSPAVWLALCIPIVPLLAFLPLIRSSSRFAGTFWGKASLSEVQVYYESILGSGITCILCCLAIAGLYRMLRYRSVNASATGSMTFPPEEIVLGIALTCTPVIAYLFGKTITGVFVWRYAIGGLVGMAILFGFFCFRLFRRSAIAGWLIVLTIAASFLISARMNMRTLADRQASLKDLIAWLGDTGQSSEPLVIADSQSFYALSYYSPPAMKDHYLYLVDTERSLKYLGHDTPDRSLSLLSHWFGLNVKDYQPYIESHPDMKVWFQPNPKWSWLLSALIDDGERLAVTGQLGMSILFSAKRSEMPAPR